jgi:hypothetical protein
MAWQPFSGPWTSLSGCGNPGLAACGNPGLAASPNRHLRSPNRPEPKFDPSGLQIAIYPICVEDHREREKK